MKPRYEIHYWCASHRGHVRPENQDNFICAGKYLQPDGKGVELPLQGRFSSRDNRLLGVFDGMGGEERGEMAAWIAAKTAALADGTSLTPQALLDLCLMANDDICAYTEANGLFSMGSTAAMLAFTPEELLLCNIGDSKVFRLADGELSQVSEDHCSPSPHGGKAPLTQNLGIPHWELDIEPYIARAPYREGDRYLICSDGLTDMVSEEHIQKTMTGLPLDKAGQALMSAALEAGGRDNITIILCSLEKGQSPKPWWLRGRRETP